ncbi:hypothetical protein ONZ45_g14835 [Pleurotus djamor]|nr:hypothetical protein ONZ45_g14835 [Pleurotus djamor]
MSEVGGGLGGGGNRMSLSSSGHLSGGGGGMGMNGEMREFGDDGMGGRLAGSTIGAGVVTPFMLSRPSQPNANASSYSNLPPGAAPSAGGGGLSVPVGGYYPSEKQRMAAHYAQQQQPPSSQRLPNPYDLNSSPSQAGPPGVYPPQPYPSPPHTATTGYGSSSSPPPPGSPTSTSHSHSMYPQSHSTSTGPSAFVGGFVPQGQTQSQAGYESSESHYGTTTNTNTSADGKRYGPRLGVANPDEGEASASNVLVHRDGGRVKAAEAEAERREMEEVDEIPPTYESVAGGGGGGRSDTQS